MNIRRIANIRGGQDGAIFGKYLFRFTPRGEGHVYDLEAIEAAPGESFLEVASFTLDRAEDICPHSNAVMFGKEYYAPDDEFPLLYANIYNNYAKTDRPLKGVCCVYRLQRDDDSFKTTLVQLIEIGFVEDSTLWKLKPEADGVRPYGNFTIDAERGIYYGFVMRDEESGTSYFAFDLPKVTDGEVDEAFGVRKVVLNASDIKKHFVCPAHHYIQGACCHGGKIYSLEGFKNTPALRIIDPERGEQEAVYFFSDYGVIEETEFIDFYGNTCYYSDCRGGLYIIEL